MWKRSGQIASIVGIDYPAALLLLPAGADRAEVIRLMKPWEAGLISGSVKHAARHQPKDQTKDEEG